jgi:hypothetical protein
MQTEPSTVITVGPLPPNLDDLPNDARQELLARIAYAMDYTTVPAPQASWPRTIGVYIEVYQEPNPPIPTGIDFHELHHLYFPANGHGFYSNDQWNGVWFRVGATWDDESPSTINRDWFGNLQHWM